MKFEKINNKQKHRSWYAYLAFTICENNRTGVKEIQECIVIIIKLCNKSSNA